MRSFWGAHLFIVSNIILESELVTKSEAEY